MLGEQRTQLLCAGTQLRWIGVHKNGRSIAIGVGLLDFGPEPIELRICQREVRAAIAGRNDVEKQAAMPGGGDGFRQRLRPEHAVECVEASRVEIVVAGQDVQRNRQAGRSLWYEPYCASVPSSALSPGRTAKVTRPASVGSRCR